MTSRHSALGLGVCAFILSLVAGGRVLADTTNLIASTTFEPAVYDDHGIEIAPAQRPPRSPESYEYSWGYMPAPAALMLIDSYFLEPPRETNTLLQFNFDNTAFNPIPTGAAYDVGFSMPQNWIDKDPSLLSANRRDYLLSLDLRVEGLKAVATNAACEIQVVFSAPDDTLDSPDADSDLDNICQVNFLLEPGTNWTRYVLNLGAGSLPSASQDETFARFLALTTEIRFGMSIHNPNGEFDFDDNNFVYLDNLKLELIKREFKVEVEVRTEGWVLTWPTPLTGVARLQSAAEATGPFTDVEGAISPFGLPLDGPRKFYRLRWQQL